MPRVGLEILGMRGHMLRNWQLVATESLQSWSRYSHQLRAQAGLALLVVHFGRRRLTFLSIPSARLTDLTNSIWRRSAIPFDQ